MELRIYGLRLGEIKEGDNISEIIHQQSVKEIGGLREGDIVVITSKIISKAKGYVLKEIKPSRKAKRLSRFSGKPPILSEAILERSKDILAIIPIKDILQGSRFPDAFTKDNKAARELLDEESCIIVAETPDGRIAADAGIDASNVPGEFYTYPPPLPDKEAKEIREQLRRLAGVDVAVVITDTEFGMYRYGSTDVAIGSSGIEPVTKCFASPDRYGKRKFGGVDIVVDEIASAAALLMRQTSEGVPVVIIRGMDYTKSEEGVNEILIERKFIRKGVFLTLIKTVFYRFFIGVIP